MYHARGSSSRGSALRRSITLSVGLFWNTPAAKSCYGRTYVDKSDGSGWLKKDATLSEKLEAQLAANQSHLYFYWVNNHSKVDQCG